MAIKSYPSNYTEADGMLQGRNKASRKLDRHTYLRRDNVMNLDLIGVKYHDTYVVTFYPDNRIALNSGGWRTMTTKARINSCNLPYTLYQDSGVWYVSKSRWTDREPYIFQDGMVINADGTITGALSYTAKKKFMQDKKAILAYVKEYMARLMAHQLPKPSGADCWYCALESQDGRSLGEIAGNHHIKDHIKERYYVPSLVMQAIKRFPISQIGNVVLANAFGYSNQLENWGRPIAQRQIASSLKRYLYEQLGIAS